MLILTSEYQIFLSSINNINPSKQKKRKKKKERKKKNRSPLNKILRKMRRFKYNLMMNVNLKSHILKGHLRRIYLYSTAEATIVIIK